MTPALLAVEAAGARASAGGSGDATMISTADAKPTLGQPWSKDEHLAFLKGLQELGKGRWKDIAKRYVIT